MYVDCFSFPIVEPCLSLDDIAFVSIWVELYRVGRRTQASCKSERRARVICIELVDTTCRLNKHVALNLPCHWATDGAACNRMKGRISGMSACIA